MTDLQTAVAIPAGWYPDPADASAFRWWSGETWTEHTAASEAPVVEPAQERVAEPAATFPATTHQTATYPATTHPATTHPATSEYPDRPDFTRFSSDPLVVGQPVGSATVSSGAVRRKDPYRERNVFSGIAIAVAVLGLVVFLAGQVMELPDAAIYVAAGTPTTVAILAIVVANRNGRGMMLAVIAAVLSLANLGLFYALSAAQAREDVNAALQGNPTFQRSLEQAVIASSNTLGMPGVADAADCPDITVPAKGTVTDCTVTFDNGHTYVVHVTAKDGLGGMVFELVDDQAPVGAETTQD